MSILLFKTEYSGGYASVPTAGFVSLSSAILRCAEPPASALDGDPQTDALALWLAQAEDELWPGVLDALESGDLQAYGVLPGKGLLPIDKGFWSFIESERMPQEIQWLLPQKKSVPWVRIGDLEWLAPFQAMRARWTTDQALIWLCARDIHPVGLASPLRREARLTWPSFSRQVPFRVMPRVEAMRKLRDDVLSGRLKGLSGSRPLDVERLDGAEWHRVFRDDLAYWTLRDTKGQLHGFVLDPAEVMALYPPMSIASNAGSIDGVEPQGEPISPVAGITLPAHRQSEELLKDKLRQMLRSWDETGQIPALRPKESHVIDAGKSFGIKRDSARAIWKEIRSSLPDVDWSAPGRKSTSQPDD